MHLEIVRMELVRSSESKLKCKGQGNKRSQNSVTVAVQFHKVALMNKLGEKQRRERHFDKGVR